MDTNASHNIPRSILYRACLQFARVGFVAALACLCYWVLYFGSRFYSEDKYWALSELEVLYGCKDALLAPSCAGQELLHYNVVFLWLAPTVLAVAATAILILQPLASHAHSSTGKVWLQRLLPPRAFWLYWCEGLTVQDALLIAFWAAANAVWLSAILNRSFKTLLPYRLAMYGLKYPTHSIRAKTLARAFGSLLAPNLVMLFYPVSRGSVVLQALQISYPAAIRYHRWLGHATLTFVLLHGGMYWSAFMYDGVWVRHALSRDDNVNHLMGSIGFVFAMCLWLSALEIVRRRSYVVFKTMHHIGFWGFLVFGCCHYWGLVWNFLPGLMLYAVDAVYRLHQVASGSSTGSSSYGSAKSNSQLPALNHRTASDSSRSDSSDSQPEFQLSHQSQDRSSAVQILHSDVSPDGSMCSLVLHIPQFAAALNGFIWLCVPDISWFAYHPYTYVAVPWQIGRAQFAAGEATAATVGQGVKSVTAVVLHIKGYNRWSKKLVALVGNRGTNISVKVQGPYAELPGPVTGHNVAALSSPSSAKKQKLPDAVVVVAGGNGVTEAFSVLSELSALRPGLPVLLIWSSRLRGELECLTPRVISMAQAAGVQLTVKLYYTGSTALLLKDIPSNSPTLAFPDTLAIKIDAAPSSNLSAFEGSFIDTTTLSNPSLTIMNSASHTSQNSYSSSGSAEATSPTVVETIPAPATVNTNHLDGVPAVATNNECEGHLVTSSLCPVVALGSHWGSAGYKMVLLLVMLTGAFCALLLARYLTVILPSHPLPTDQMGAIHLALIIAFMLIPGFIILWASLLITKCRSKLSSQNHPSNTQHVGVSGVDMCAPAVGTACAAAAAMAATVRRGVVAKLVPSGTTSPLTTKASAVLRVDSRPRSLFQLLVPHHASPNIETSERIVIPIPVEVGRPPTPQLVKGWLASIQQLPKAVAADETVASSTSTNNGGNGAASRADSASTGSGPVNCTVYAMGPPALVAGVQMLCDDVNRQGGGGLLCGRGARKQTVRLQFVRKTHEF